MRTQGKKIAKNPRAKKKLRVRSKITGTEARPRLCVFRSSKHMYAQLISDQSQRTIASASTLESEVADELKQICTQKGISKASTKSVHAAEAVGVVLAKRSKAANLTQVVFDRNGFLYAGRIQAIATGARKGGLDF